MTERIAWAAVVEQASAVVEQYDTAVTLRQLFYRLVAAHLLPNTDSAYKQLSAKTADARRRGVFPPLMDRGRSIHRASFWESPVDAIDSLRWQYRLDRTAGQDVSIYIGVEKAGLVVQLQSWFGRYGIPIVALGGYSSQTYVDEVARDVARQTVPTIDMGVFTRRPGVLLYAGDFDPSGEDIDRDFVERSGCWEKVVRVALTAGQVEEYDLPPAMGKQADSRAGAFIERHGRLVQVELDALPPDVLRSLYADAIADFWDESKFEAVLERERSHVAQLVEMATILGRDT